MSHWIDWAKANSQGHLFHEGNVSHHQQIAKELAVLDSQLPGGGLTTHIANAKRLLEDSRQSKNPFEFYEPTIPDQTCLNPDSPDFMEIEKHGLDQLAQTAFILVAGGLGERLGYPDIKVKLFVDVATQITHMEFYVRAILGSQRYIKDTENQDVILPLFIMTSGDTHEKTIQLLEGNNYFGLRKEQVTVACQNKVPAFLDNEAHIALNDQGSGILTKPHGHGDVHTLIYQSNLHKQWKAQGIKWLFFFQDTNALALRALPLCLGISAKHGYDMNSLCCPRQPGEKVGAISKLRNINDPSDSLTINVEYNQLDALLKSSGLDGDVAAKGSIFSPFPGNCNILTFSLNAYHKALEVSRGVVPEFVNPKYADDAKTLFKSPTRLECMMQEFARLLPPNANIGCTVLDRSLCFSPIKNNLGDAAAKSASGSPSESAFSAESDLWMNSCSLLERAAKELSLPFSCPPAVTEEYCGIKARVRARVFIDPHLAISVTQCMRSLREAQLTKLELRNDRVYIIRDGTKEEYSGSNSIKYVPVDCSDESEDPNYRVRGYKASL